MVELTVSPAHQRLRDRVMRFTRFDLLPTDAVQEAFARGHSAGDPIAERFVAQTYHGDLGPERSRELLDEALRVGIANVPDAPESMRELFAEFETIPEWVDPTLVEQGAAVWRRWAYSLGAVGNAGTMDTYTEASLAVPLSFMPVMMMTGGGVASFLASARISRPPPPGSSRSETTTSKGVR